MQSAHSSLVLVLARDLLECVPWDSDEGWERVVQRGQSEAVLGLNFNHLGFLLP